MRAVISVYASRVALARLEGINQVMKTTSQAYIPGAHQGERLLHEGRTRMHETAHQVLRAYSVHRYSAHLSRSLTTLTSSTRPYPATHLILSRLN